MILFTSDNLQAPLNLSRYGIMKKWEKDRPSSRLFNTTGSKTVTMESVDEHVYLAQLNVICSTGL